MVPRLRFLFWKYTIRDLESVLPDWERRFLQSGIFDFRRNEVMRSITNENSRLHWKVFSEQEKVDSLLGNKIYSLIFIERLL